MTKSLPLRKAWLTAHVVTSVGWLGAAAAYASLAMAASKSSQALVVRAAYLAMEPMMRFAIVPLAVGSFVTGVVLSVGTPWGLLKHYWVVFKLLLTVAATTVLVMNTRTVQFLSSMAASTEDVGTTGLQGQLLHASGGVAVLLLATTLAVVKPRGLTAYGWRRQQAQGANLSGAGPAAQ